jgi:hypothetical protein
VTALAPVPLPAEIDEDLVDRLVERRASWPAVMRMAWPSTVQLLSTARMAGAMVSVRRLAIGKGSFA